ncbi:Hypothetical predicted protein [Mytilus galloprovincialis]|uniref:TIR domain-containing protein n=1 Tax=Mytilus galloprovincialis TaxID=29158 RepID=A0A8B6FMI5_MYTGA|nr:Hypothetical predicted protein [Mytilus galloprovincialis]
MRIIGYVIMCIVNAVILSYLIYLILLLVLYGWFHILVRTDLYNSTISVEFNDILRNDDCVLPPLQSFERTVSWEIYRNNNNFSRQSVGVDATFNGKKLPICRRIYYRVEGEDVDINCHIDNTDGSVILKEGNMNRMIHIRIFENLEWDLGKKLSTDSYKLSNVKLMHSSESNITLRITDLSAENFKEEITLWGINKFIDTTLKIKIGSFFINKQKEILKPIHVPEGHILSLNSLIFYSFSKTDDHLVVHNISSLVEANISGNTNAVCSNFFNGCGPMIDMLFNMSKVGNIFNEKPWTRDMMLNAYQVTTSLIETGIQIAKSFTCVCEKSYGQHTYSILRPLYNPSSNQTYISEIVLPYTFLILPKGLTHFASNKYKELQKDVRKAIDEKKNNWRYIWRYYVDDQRFYYLIICKAEYIISLIIVADIVMILGIFMKVYCNVFVNNLARIILKPRFPMQLCAELHVSNSNANIGDCVVDGNVTHDIMIVASDDDYSFAVHNLIPFFSDLGLSCILPQTDIKGGQSKINGFSQAVVSSKIYVVVGTTDFENDPWNNSFVLSNLILPHMYEQQYKQHRILIIKFNDVNIPRPLRWYEHVTIADWSTRRTDEDNFRTLKNKFKSVIEELLMTEKNLCPYQ